jgi:hypothetical protein
MLKITTPPGCTAERAYVLGVVFGDWLAIPYAVEQSGQREVTIEAAGLPGVLCLPDTFFSGLTTSPERWLAEGSLPAFDEGAGLPRWDSRELASDIVLAEPLVPVIFGDHAVGPGGHSSFTARPEAGTGPQPGIAGDDHTGERRLHLPLDIFGAAFFMLSRYEEAVLPQRDAHDRFPATASVAYRAGFLDRPVVDEYVEILWAAMRRLWPGLKRKRSNARTLVSCDVDSPFAYAGRPGQAARRFAADMMRRRAPRLATRNLRGQWRARRGDHSGDPHRAGLQYIMDVNERAGRAVAFYFIAAKTDAHYDKAASLDDPRMRQLLREIHSRGHEIGIHPGYNTYKHPEAMAKAVSTLRRVREEEEFPQENIGGRQHYLRWDVSTTPQLWDDNALTYDSTLSYADRPGFRCGTCREYPLYDLHRRRPLSLRERPLIVMECSVIAERYLGLGYSDEALRLMQYYRDLCRKFGGNFTLLWHNSHFGCDADRAFYEALVA